MKIHPSAKRHATEIIKLIESLLESNYNDYEGSDLYYEDYQKIREKLENKFNRLIEKNKDSSDSSVKKYWCSKNDH